MEAGQIVEFIDREKIITTVILEVKNQRLRLLTENNREVKLSANRIIHKSNAFINPSFNREKTVDSLKEISSRRKNLSTQVDVKELWEVLNSEQEWIDLPTMTAFCFPENPTSDHESAVIRAFFKNRLYFKFDHDRFFPYSKDYVEQAEAQIKENEAREAFIEDSSNWLKYALKEQILSIPEDKRPLIEMLKSYYLFQNEDKDYQITKAILTKAGLDYPDKILELLIKLQVWDENENIDLYRMDVAVEFTPEIMEYTKSLTLTRSDSRSFENNRRDLTSIPTMTIDGNATLDFDDALSIEYKDGYYHVGVHITDVCQLIKKQSPLDQEAIRRGSTIYMPDQKIPMLPASISEDICSLKAGEIRPAISVLMTFNQDFEMITHEILPTLIRVDKQLSYHEVNLIAEENQDIIALTQIASHFRQKRLNQGAIQITLPEINIWVNENKEIIITRTNRESPGRMLISELMIMANWLMANFIADHQLPAIFRSQPEPKEILFKNGEGTLFQNWMQRKQLSRYILNPTPERHSGLGLDAYVTATSPIRKYSDMITQRQIRAIFSLEEPHTINDIEYTIQNLAKPLSIVSKLQNQRKRYWLLKYLENRIGQKEEALVLGRRKNDYLVLLPEYLIECTLPIVGNMDLKPEDTVEVVIHQANSHKDVLSIQLS